MEPSGPVHACNGVALLLLYQPSGSDSIQFNSIQSIKTCRLNGTGPIKRNTNTCIHKYTGRHNYAKKPKTDKIVSPYCAPY